MAGVVLTLPGQVKVGRNGGGPRGGREGGAGEEREGRGGAGEEREGGGAGRGWREQSWKGRWDGRGKGRRR